MSEIASPHHVRNRAPRWLQVVFALGVLPPLLLAGGSLGGLLRPEGGVLNLVVSIFLSAGMFAWLSVQVSALAGLLAHRHWAREVALLAQFMWGLVALGMLVMGLYGLNPIILVAAAIIVIGFFATRSLLGGWDLGPAPVYEEAIHPHGWVTWASRLGTALILPFLAFVIWAMTYVHSVVPSLSAGSLGFFGAVIVMVTLPWFAVHAFAAYGLDHRHDYGLVVAIIGGVLWFFTLVGIPLGLAQLYSVWKTGHPVLALSNRPLPAGGAPA